ncbi:MAG TPA: DUF5908 family protein [Saprospiraceae bacterium]|nr:DUF5908 family protein [Saprospiraceae bacterium]HNM24479.1 DUF5908 family protein [Saprospiraceae bacterium]
MPLEIRELIVKATVDSSGSASGASTDAGNGSNGNEQASQEQLINLCVEKVLEILKEKAER